MTDEKDVLLHHAREEIVAAVTEWMKDRPWNKRELTPAEERLRAAFYQHERTKRVTGKVKVATPSRGTKVKVKATPPSGIEVPNDFKKKSEDDH